jgi:hypothetical protein
VALVGIGIISCILRTGRGLFFEAPRQAPQKGPVLGLTAGANQSRARGSSRYGPPSATAAWAATRSAVLTPSNGLGHAHAVTTPRHLRDHHGWHFPVALRRCTANPSCRAGRPSSPCRNRYGNSGGGAKSRCHCLLPHPLTSRWRHARSAQRLAALPPHAILDSVLVLTRLPLSDVMIEFMAQPHRGLLL